MNYTINEIPDEAVELSGTEMIPIWQGETKKVSVATLAGYVQDIVDLGPDYANGVTTQLSTTSGDTSTGELTTTFTATEDCYFVARHYTINAGSVKTALNLTINLGDTFNLANAIYSVMLPEVYGAGVVNPPIKLFAGQTITISYSGYSGLGYCKNYTVYPVKRGN